MDPVSSTNNSSVNPIIIGVILAIVIIGGAVWYWQSQKTPTIETRDDAIDAAVAQPVIEVPSSEVVGDKAPELNPIERANPFKDSYKNPFE